MKGIGEIGITGSAAAVGNAVCHATGKRIRELPITPDKLLKRRCQMRSGLVGAAYPTNGLKGGPYQT